MTLRTSELLPTYSVKALKGESLTFHGLGHPELTWRSSIFVIKCS